MRILMLNYEFPPLGAGGATSSFNLARHIVRLGHDVDMVTMAFRGVPRREVVEGINVYREPSVRARREVCHTHEMMTYVLSGTWRAARLVREQRYDVCNAHFIFPTGPVAYATRRLGGPPYVLTARGSDVPGHNPNRFRLDHRLLEPVWRHLVRDASRVVAVSQNLADRIRSHAPELDVVVIPNGSSPLRLDADDANGAAPSPRRTDSILSVNRLHEFKGVQYLLEAAARIPSPPKIDIVGDGPYRATLEQRARQLGVPATFWGWLDRSSEDMLRLYQEAGVFVFPSEREGSPAVLQEAMALGIPVIAANSAGSPEVVGDAGLLVPPRDPDSIASALLRLRSEPGLAEDLGRRARERVERMFDWSVLARRYVELYEEVAAKGR
ncbi:MAG: glycosyltransferase family 4 protein [Chloroflexota bacterium]